MILWTIAFINLWGFQSSARDSRRVSDMSNISQAIELAIVRESSAPIPTNAVSYTGGSVTIQMGTVTNTIVPRMSGDFTDPITKAPYNYSVFGNGSYYQLGIDFENPLSFHTGIPGIETVYASIVPIIPTKSTYSKLSGNYIFDPSLPSLFVISGSINSASGGIFSPDACFVMNNVSTNTFSSSSTGCVAKKSMNLKDTDSSLVGYWDMETLTSSGLLKDLSGNGNDGTFSGGMVASTALTGGVIGKGLIFSWNTSWNCIEVNYNSSFKPSKITMSAVFYWFSGFNNYPYIITNWYPSTNPSGTMLGVALDKLRTYIFKTSTWLTDIQDWENVLEWRYYLWTMSYDWNELKSYLNWILISKRIVTDPIYWEPTAYKWLLFWRAMYNTSSNLADFNGIIDDIKIYNRALSDLEIKQQAKIAGF